MSESERSSDRSGVYDPSPGALLGATAKFSFNLVGWGTDAGTGKKYWIARNSLGEDWGQDGFFLLIRGKNKDFEKTSVSYIHKI